jgi:hypothetical protein
VTALADELIRTTIAVDVLNMGTAIYWRRRAEMFESAKPRPGERRGNLTNAELSAAWRRCHASAEACRSRAKLAEMGGESWAPAPTRLAS